MARFLLENGANVNIKDGYYGTALQAALVYGHESVYGHEEMARLLLKYGVDVNIEGEYHGSALQASLQLESSCSVLNILLE